MWNVITDRPFFLPTFLQTSSVLNPKSEVSYRALAFYSITSRTVFRLGALLILEAPDTETEGFFSLLARLALSELSFSSSKPRFENSFSQPVVMEGLL